MPPLPPSTTDSAPEVPQGETLEAPPPVETSPETESGPLTVDIGVDSGKNGAIAVIVSGEKLPRFFMMRDKTPQDLCDFFDHLEADLEERGDTEGYCVVVEKVGGFIQGGENRQPGSHMFEFGRTYGRLEQALTDAGYGSINEVIPRTWQKAMGISPRAKGKMVMKTVTPSKGKHKGKKVKREVQLGGETESQFKKRLRDEAAKYYPDGLMAGVADALLIAIYAKKLREGNQ